jgi:hypothetical protein
LHELALSEGAMVVKRPEELELPRFEVVAGASPETM